MDSAVFFGTELKAGVTVSPKVPPGHVLCIKQFALPANATKKITIYVTIDGLTMAVGTLDPNKKVYQLCVDICFSALQKFGITGQGEGSVHITGFIQNTGDSGDFSDDDDDEDSAPPLKAKNKESEKPPRIDESDNEELEEEDEDEEEDFDEEDDEMEEEDDEMEEEDDDADSEENELPSSSGRGQAQGKLFGQSRGGYSGRGRK